MCMIDDADHATLQREQRRKSRTPHRCGECRRRISPGETYLYASCLMDGRFVADRQCAHCSAAAELLMRHCHGFLFGAVGEDLENHFHQPVAWRIRAGRYAIGIRRKWRRFRGDGLMPVPREANAP